MPRKKLPTFEGLTMERMAAKGFSIAHAPDGKTILVKGAVPGDVANVQITKKKRRFLEGKATLIQQKSPDRVTPVCQHFGYCGGCKWQNLSYQAQLKYKAEEVKNNLERIGHVKVREYLPILGCEKQYTYRNKMEFSFSDRAWLTPEEINSGETFDNRNALGFHIPGQWSKVLHIEACHLQPEPSNNIRNWVYDFANQHGFSFWNPYKQDGLMRTLMVKTSTLGQTMVLVQFGKNESENIEQILSAMANEFKIESLYYAINTKGNDSIYDLDLVLFKGSDTILEAMGDLRFLIGPKSFYQTNSEQALKLYEVVVDFADFQGYELVFDLYSGLGTIAQFVAGKTNKVIGIESVPEAVNAASKNAALNTIENCQFLVGDMRNVFTDEFLINYGRADIIITDPPRDGMHPKVVEQILKCKPKKVVYVSCNSATQARDLAILSEKYEVMKSQAVDMFPQTHHVENVVLLALKADS